MLEHCEGITIVTKFFAFIFFKMSMCVYMCFCALIFNMVVGFIFKKKKEKEFIIKKLLIN